MGFFQPGKALTTVLVLIYLAPLLYLGNLILAMRSGVLIKNINLIWATGTLFTILTLYFFILIIMSMRTNKE